ncbi:MAG: GAF domain-containing protein [Acidobacteria bacterium]|nr:GAF domain-containing protein [Acidobacteriota bacterium]
MDLLSKLPALRNVIREIRTSIHENTHMSDVLDMVARKASNVIGAKGALVRVLNLETGTLDFFASYGLEERYLSKGPATNIKLIGQLCEMNEIVVIDDILNSPRVQFPKEAWEEGVRMIVDAPLIVQQPLVGLLRMHFTEVREIDRIEKHFLTSVAEQCASAIDKAYLIETQRFQYDQLTHQTEKLAALGRMAAGIAHEINNPLAGILLYSSHLSKKVAPDSPIHEGLQVISHETARCRDIIQNLLEFSRNDKPRRVPADLNKVIEQALNIVENELRLHHIRLVRHLTADLPEIPMDANQIEQVFVNLLINATEAIGEEGTVTVSSRQEEGGGQLTAEISDTGIGIPRDIVGKIFEPFFSTKAKGTGLGLSVSYGIVQNHKGTLRVSSSPGKGTRFTVTLPVITEGKAADPVTVTQEIHNEAD